MKKVFLISEDVIKKGSVIDDNVSGDLIAVATETAQEIYLQQLIGSSLLRSLCNKVENNSLSVDDVTLLQEYIEPYLKYKVLAEITIPLSFKYRNAGVVQTSTEHVTNASFKESQSLSQFYDQRADFFAIRLTNWLCNNQAKFPSYKTECGGIQPDDLSFNTGIYL